MFFDQYEKAEDNVFELDPKTKEDFAADDAEPKTETTT